MEEHIRKQSVILATLIAVTLIAMTAAADSPDYERIWSYAEVHRGAEDAFLQAAQLSGRFQVDQAYLESNAGDHAQTKLRRFRFGAAFRFSGNVTLHAEAELDPQEADPVYRRLTDAYVAWAPSDALELTVGKHSAPFTVDGSTSSKELLAMDRSNLTNNVWFTDEYIPGISIAGEAKGFVYHVGVYSSGGKNRGFGDSDGGEFVLATIGRDFGSRLGVPRALLRFNYVDNEADPRNDFTKPLERVGSLNFTFDAGDWGLDADVSAALGYSQQSDLRGVMVMPHYSFGESLQLVARYTHVRSDEPNGVRFARYESEVLEGRGDRYRELYVGLNHYWYGHKLKLQTGLQYVDMDDRAGDGGSYAGWGWTTGFRLSW